jgi:hypothetical protein
MQQGWQTGAAGWPAASAGMPGPGTVPPGQGAWPGSWAPPQPPPEQEANWLKTQANLLEQQLGQINARIAEMEQSEAKE